MIKLEQNKRCSFKKLKSVMSNNGTEQALSVKRWMALFHLFYHIIQKPQRHLAHKCIQITVTISFSFSIMSQQIRSRSK